MKLREPRKVQLLQLCNLFAFSMQIGNYRACATIIILRNEFSKNEGDFRKNPTEAIIVLYEYFPVSTDLWRDHCQSAFEFYGIINQIELNAILYVQTSMKVALKLLILKLL